MIDVLNPLPFSIMDNTFVSPHCAAISPTLEVTNTGPRGGDEVVQIYHAAGDDIRKRVDHPVPIKALRGFERITVAQSAKEEVTFPGFNVKEALLLVNKDGDEVLYDGLHHLIFTNGVKNTVTFDITVKSGIVME